MISEKVGLMGEAIPPPGDDATIGDGKEYLRAHWDEGARCPCCTQLVKVYRRPFPHAAAKLLVEGFRVHGRAPFHPGSLVKAGLLDQVATQGGYLTMSQHWDLLEPAHDVGVGFWRITAAGEEFLRGIRTVPKYVHLYDGRKLKHSGPDIGIGDALGEHFDFAALMGTAST